MAVIETPVNTPDAWSQRAHEIAEPWTACGWSYESQGVRFERVVDALRPEQGEWLLDYGCGTGDLSAYLHPEVGYFGFDWSDGMIIRAVSEHGGPTRRFKTHLPATAHTFDVVACIGPFNLAEGWSKQRTWHTIRHLWDTTGCRALVACLYAGDDEHCLTYTEGEIAGCGRDLGFHATVERILPNDLMLVARR